MAERTIAIEIPLLLPEVEDARDQCVSQLRTRLLSASGIHKAHIEGQNGGMAICLHYEPHLISLSQVRRLAEEAGAAITERYRHESLMLAGMDCGDCAASIEHVLSRMPGILHVSVNYAAERMRVEYDTAIVQAQDIRRRIHYLGYEIVEDQPETWLAANWRISLAILSGVFLAAGYLGERWIGWPTPIPVLLYALAYLAGGFEAARHGLAAAWHRRFDVDFLMVVAAIGAASLGDWSEGAFLLFLFSLGHALERYAMDRARNAIRALEMIAPKTARVRRAGRTHEIATASLERGDVVIVRPGERIPADGQIIAGHSAVDQSAITGESVPVDKTSGDVAFAGSLNSHGALEIEVTRLARESSLARAIRLVEEAQTQKPRTQSIVERFSRIFVPAVLATVFLILAVPPALGWLPFQEALRRAITVLVAASPCALAITTPAVVISAIGRAASSGVLFKGGVHLENLGRTRAIALDKTGTLTRGKLQLTDHQPFAGGSGHDALVLAAAVESNSKHPIALAILQEADRLEVSYPAVTDLRDHPGLGVQARVDGHEVRIGNLDFIQASGHPLPAGVIECVAKFEREGKTTILVQAGGELKGVLAFADRPRQTARETLARLRELGIHALVMLSGDNPVVSAAIAKQVGITDYQASLLPESKATTVRELIERHHHVAMVGDGVNDAPALASATVGIAMGGGGTDVAMETADIVLMADDISQLPFAIGLAQFSRRILRQNLAIAAGVIALLVPAAVFGLTGIGAAISLHEGSTLLVVLNALRLLRYRRK